MHGSTTVVLVPAILNISSTARSITGGRIRCGRPAGRLAAAAGGAAAAGVNIHGNTFTGRLIGFRLPRFTVAAHTALRARGGCRRSAHTLRSNSDDIVDGSCSASRFTNCSCMHSKLIEACNPAAGCLVLRRRRDENSVAAASSPSSPSSFSSSSSSPSSSPSP